MSVRRVNCPGCNAALNVPATMANARCPGCGTVWDVNHPNNAKVAAKQTNAKGPSDQPSSKPSAKESKTKSAAARRRQTAAITVAGGMLALLVFGGVAVVMMTGGQDSPPAAQTPVEAETPKEKVVYRIVNLSEAMRKKIYYDYRLAAGSSVEKKVMVSKDSVTAKTLGKTMNLMMDREIKMQALINKISEDDMMQIIAEGDDKGWPPKKKTPPAKPAS